MSAKRKRKSANTHAPVPAVVKTTLESIPITWMTALTAQAPVGIAIADGEGKIVFVNETMARMLDLSVDDLIGKLLTDFHPPAVLERLRKEGRYQGTLRHKHKDGHMTIASLTATVVRDAEGKPESYIASMFDIGKQKATEERLRHYTERLHTAAEIASLANRLEDPLELLQAVINAIVDRFGIYYAHVYTLDPREDVLYLRAGYGEAGKEMLRRGHHIPLDREQSLVAQAARTGEMVVVPDVQEEPNFLPNELLPKTRSEVAIPLKLGDEVIGVLDVQDDVPAAFSEADLSVFTTLAEQIASSFRNAEIRKARELYAERLQTAAEIAVLANSVQDPDALLQVVIDAIVERFGIYYAHAYTLDAESGILKLRAGYGGPGQEMLRRGHSIPLDREQSLVAKAARTGEMVVVPDVSKEPNFMPNELLPHTRSEVAIPLMVGQEVIGVLDVQDSHPNAFSEGDLSVFTTLAAHITTAFRNAEAIQRQEMARREREHYVERLKAAAEIATLANRLQDPDVLLQAVIDAIVERFGIYYAHVYTLDMLARTLFLRAGYGEPGRRMLEVGHSIPLDREQSLVAKAARTGEMVVVPDVRKEPNFLPNKLLPDTRSEVAIPLRLGDEVVGVLDVQDDEPDAFTEADLSVFTTLAEQIAATFRNVEALQREEAARRERERYAERLRIAAEIATLANRLQDPAVLLQEVIDAIVERFGIYYAHAYTLDEEEHLLRLEAGYGEAGEEMLRRGHSIPLDREQSLVAQAARTGEMVVVPDVRQEPNFLPNELLPETRSEVAIPMKISGEVIGVLDVQDDKPKAFTDADLSVFTTLAEQIAAAVHNAQLLQQEAASRAERELYASRLNIAAEMAAEVSTIHDPLRMLERMITLYKERFDLYHVHYYSLDEEAGLLRLVAGYGEPGRIMRQQGHSIPVDREQSLVARAARTKKVVLANDVSREPGFLPNLLLPDTKAEVAIPILIENRVVGVFDVQADKVGYFTEADLSVYRTLARLASTALQNARLFEQQQKAEAEIRSTVARIRTTLDTLKDGVLTSGMTGVIEDANRAAWEMLQLTREELLGGHNILEFIVPEDRTRAASVFTQALEAGRSQPVEVRMRRRDGVTFIAELNAAMLPQIEGQSEGFITTVRDITSLKRRERQLQLSAEISRAITTYQDVKELMTVAPELVRSKMGFYHIQIYFYDEEADALIPRAGTGEISKRIVADGRVVPMSDEMHPMVRAARTREVVIINDLEADEDFDLREYLPEARAEAVVPVFSGDRLMIVDRVFMDRPHSFEEEDVLLFRALSTQIATALSRARYVEELRETAQRLQELDRLKSEFLANMSHELRTPLNSVIGYAEMILMGVDGELTDEMREDVLAIYENGQHLLSMINDILDLAKIEAGRMSLDIHPIDLRTILEEIASSGEGLLQKQGSSVKLEVIVDDNLPLVPADQLRIHQVFNNLVSNAIKFTEEGYIRIYARREGQWAVITVEDTGVGIPEEAREIIFEKFRQADGSYTRKAQGTGLGLAITRSLVEMHGGTLTLESEVGKGSTFTVRLPLFNSSNNN